MIFKNRLPLLLVLRYEYQTNNSYLSPYIFSYSLFSLPFKIALFHWMTQSFLLSLFPPLLHVRTSSHSLSSSARFNGEDLTSTAQEFHFLHF